MNNMNNFNKGDFIITSESNFPALVIEKNSQINNQLLISINGYNGDYKFCSINNITKADITIEEELSIIANFGNFFYDQHKLLYQEKIINCIILNNT